MSKPKRGVEWYAVWPPICQALRKARINAGLSMNGLASLSGVGLTQISNIEHGESTQLTTLYKLCAALGVEVSEILPPIDILGGGDYDR